jgi:hypothetical protein
MEVRDIAAAAEVKPSTIRYVIAHRFVFWASGRLVRGRPGRPLRYDPYSAFALGAAGLLFEFGVRRELATNIVRSLDVLRWPVGVAPDGDEFPDGLGFGERALGKLMATTGRAEVAVGDGTALRIRADKADTDWFEPVTKAKLQSYRPRVTIELDLAPLRNAIARSVR